MDDNAEADLGPADTPFAFDVRNANVKRGLERVGVIDVGSNSVRLVIFDGAARSPAYFFNEKIMCGLGEGLAVTGVLNPEGRARALAALSRFRVLARNLQASLTGVATAAVREATDGADFVAEAARVAGVRLRVASGEEEARLSAQGVLLGWPGARGMVCDIGGASMELAEVGDGRVRRAMTSPLGPLKLFADNPSPVKLKKRIDAELDRLRATMDGDYRRFYLVGGSWRALARLDMERRGYPLKVLHEYEVSADKLLATARWARKRDLAELQAMSGSSMARLRLVPVATRILEGLMARFRPDQIAVSSYGIREGLLYQAMPEELRRRDPLIEACYHMEANAARMPGFGKALYNFLKPAFPALEGEDRRLMKAACLLHDVTWRAHPDYRAEVCFDNATRANLGGLDHAGRVFLGFALLHRYKNRAVGAALSGVAKLLPPDRLALAETIGKAMRFGAMLSGSSARNMGRLELTGPPDAVVLHLPEAMQPLYGEVVEDRFQSFAAALGRAHQVRITTHSPPTPATAG